MLALEMPVAKTVTAKISFTAMRAQVKRFEKLPVLLMERLTVKVVIQKRHWEKHQVQLTKTVMRMMKTLKKMRKIRQEEETVILKTSESK